MYYNTVCLYEQKHHFSGFGAFHICTYLYMTYPIKQLASPAPKLRKNHVYSRELYECVTVVMLNFYRGWKATQFSMLHACIPLFHLHLPNTVSSTLPYSVCSPFTIACPLPTVCPHPVQSLPPIHTVCPPSP